MCTRFAAALAVCVFASATLAGPFQREHVAPDAVWLAHWDLEASSKGEFGRALIDKATESLHEWNEHRGESVDWLREMTHGVGLDMGTDLLGVTAYGGDDAEGSTTIIISHGTSELDRWKDYLVAEWGGQPLTMVIEGEEVEALYLQDLDEWEINLRVGDDERLWLTGYDLDELKRAVHVIRGRAAPLPHDSALLPKGGFPRDSFAILSAVDLQAMEEFQPASEVARQADAVWGALGQTGREAFAELTITATNAEDAGSIVDVLKGLVALGRLTLGADDEIGKEAMTVLDGIRFVADGRYVTLGLRYNVDDFADLLAKTGYKGSKEDDEDHDEDHDEDGERDEDGDPDDDLD